MSKKELTRRAFAVGVGSILSAVPLSLAIAPDVAKAETAYGEAQTESAGGYTGTTSCHMNWKSGEFVSYISALDFSYPCIPGSVITNLWMTGGANVNAISGEYTNRTQGTHFSQSLYFYDVHDTRFGGMFCASGFWNIPTCANFMIYSSQVCCSMYGLRSTGVEVSRSLVVDGKEMTAVMGQDGNMGYSFADDLQPFGGATGEEALAFLDVGYRIVDVYDTDGRTKIDEYVIECLPLETLA